MMFGLKGSYGHFSAVAEPGYPGFTLVRNQMGGDFKNVGLRKCFIKIEIRKGKIERKPNLSAILPEYQPLPHWNGRKLGK